MGKIKVTKAMLKRKERSIIAKGINNGRKVVAVTGSVGDWAGYVEPPQTHTEVKNWNYQKVRESGWKIYSSEVNNYFNVTKEVKAKYRR